ELEIDELLADGLLLELLAILQLGVDPLDLGLDHRAQAPDGILAPLLAGGHDDLACRLEDDGLLGRARAERLGGGLGGLAGPDDLFGARRALLLERGLLGGQLGVQLVLLAMELGAQLVLELVERDGGLATAALGLGVELGERPLARVLVNASDDVEGEVEDALEVARADIEEDPEPARRPLEVPDVADRRGQLDVAHALAADLGASDLDAALVAEDALVADPLVLAAVTLPVLRGTEDALVEEAVLLGLEGPVVDGFRLRDLARGALADLVRSGQRDAD